MVCRRIMTRRISLIFAITVVECDIGFVFNILTLKLTVKGVLVANEIRFYKKKNWGEIGA